MLYDGFNLIRFILFGISLNLFCNCAGGKLFKFQITNSQNSQQSHHSSLSQQRVSELKKKTDKCPVHTLSSLVTEVTSELEYMCVW